MSGYSQLTVYVASRLAYICVCMFMFVCAYVWVGGVGGSGGGGVDIAWLKGKYHFFIILFLSRTSMHIHNR